MISSLHVLLSAPYNKKKPLFAIQRLLFWKWIKFMRLENYRLNIWGNRHIFLNYDSFQCMWIMYNYIVDWEEFNLISKYVKQHDHIADIGANMGFYSIWMSKFISSPGKIHSFDPDQKNFDRLIKNIKLNKLQELVVPNKLAVSDVDGELRFTVGLDGENHIVKTDRSESIQIKAIKLDTYAKQHHISEFSYVKIDVEGFEYSVLQGAKELLSDRKIQIMQLEINQALKNSGTDINDLLEQIKKYDYKLCRYDVDANSLIPIEYNKNRENYFAVHDISLANDKLRGNTKSWNTSL